MDFKPIKAKKIYEEIVDQIKDMIARGELHPGDKLIPERELAERMQVGRSAVREAYRALEAIGVLEIRPGEGTFVQKIGNKPMSDIMFLAVSTGKDTLFELMELRKIVETQVAGLAATRRTDENLKVIKMYLDQIKQDIEKGNLGDLADVKFHYAITEAARNSLLTRLMNSISETMRSEMKTVLQNLYRSHGTPKRIYEQHEQIYLAILKGDETAARSSMHNHLSSAERELRQIILD